MTWSDADEEFARSLSEGLQQKLADLDLKWKRSSFDSGCGWFRWRLRTKEDLIIGHVLLEELDEVTLHKGLYAEDPQVIPLADPQFLEKVRETILSWTQPSP
jgi:hypothetical protein